MGNGTRKGKGTARAVDRRRAVRRTVLLATASVAAVGIAAGILIAVSSTREPARGDPPRVAARMPRSTVAAVSHAQADDPSVAALARAADSVGFRQTTDTNVGVVELLPATTTLLAPSASLLPVGRQAPDFSLQTATGKNVRLSDYRGKTVLLEFFATWCPHCQAEAQHLQRLSAALASHPVAFLSVNADSEDAPSIYAFERYFGITWPALLDPGSPAGSFSKAGGAGPVTQAFGVALYPTFYIIDPVGRVKWRGDREQPDALLLQKLIDATGA
jgi:peroxiredoxin